MKTLDLKLTRIGNSRGVRLPAGLIRRYSFSDALAAEARPEGLLLKAKGQAKLSWEETAQQMAASAEDWSEWDAVIADGLGTCPWDEPVPAEVRAWAESSAQSERRARAAGRKRTKR
jgi:antitoxin component of MazEF toxin-antitoxin module